MFYAGRAKLSRLRNALCADSVDYAAIRARKKGAREQLPRVRSLVPPATEFVQLVATVKVAFIVDEKGRVIDARVFESSDSRLDEPSVAAVRKWVCYPGSLSGAPAKFLFVVPLKFADLRR